LKGERLKPKPSRDLDENNSDALFKMDEPAQDKEEIKFNKSQRNVFDEKDSEIIVK